MSDIPGRLFKVAKSYVDTARGRIQDIDDAAIAELQSALNTEYNPMSDDPMVRAASKIAAKARASFDGFSPTASPPPAGVNATFTGAASDEQLSAPEQLAALEKESAQSQATGTPISTAYRIIGIPDGSDRGVVEDTVRKLRERCAPDRFAEGSVERAEAQKILVRIDEAYTLLMRSFNIETSRFDKLEL